MAKVISQLPSGGSVPKHNNLLGLNEGDYLHLTQSEKAKLDGIQSGAEVNVNADWNAVSGDAQILNKPSTFPPSAHTHVISEVINLQNELNSKENISNKVNTISGNSYTEYPTEKAVVDYVSSQIGADFAKVVYFDNVTPNVASIFDLNNPPLVNDPSLKEDVANLYIGTDASTWVYITSPAGYVTKTVTSSGSNFYITGTSTDAGSIKTGSITKKGQIVIDSEVVNDSGLTLKKTESSILKTDSLGKVVKATNLQDVEYAPIVHTHTVSQITDFAHTHPISDVTGLPTALDDLQLNKEDKANKNIANGYAGLDSSGKIIPTQLPALAITDTFVVASQAEQLALVAEVGDVAVRTDLNKSFILRVTGASTLANWQELLSPTSVDQTIIDGSTNAVSSNAVFDGLALKSNIGHTHVASQITDLSKASVGLGNVDNTSDLSKPLSTATINALATKAPISSVHNPVTIGTANGLILSTQQLSLGLASSGVTGALSGTDWNTFNGKFNTPTGLTTNYLPKWNGSGFGNSGFYEDATGLNINGQSKGITFDNPKIGGAVYSKGITYKIDGVNKWSINVGAGDVSENYNIYSFDTSKILVSYKTNGNIEFIPDGGRILINKTDDDLTNKLQVAGTISASPATTANQVVVKSQLDAESDSQIEISANSNTLDAWNKKTILFTANCTITVPATLLSQYGFVFRTLAGVTVTWAITDPFTWETTPTTTPEKTTGSFMRRGSTNTILLDF